MGTVNERMLKREPEREIGDELEEVRGICEDGRLGSGVEIVVE